MSRLEYLFESARYTAPDDPYAKFISDLSRELTAKHFPLWNYSKRDKKNFRTPATVASFRVGFDSQKLPHFYTLDSNTLGMTCPRTGGCTLFIESEGQGEEHFVNTNSYYSKEGYNTTENLYYQGPTWKLRGVDDKEYFKTGIQRNQLADTIIEFFEKNEPSFDIKGIWDKIIERLKEVTKSNEKYYEDNTMRMANPTGEYSDYKDPSLINFIHKQFRSNELENKRIADALEEPALPKDLNSSDAPERKKKSWFGGEIWTTYHPMKIRWVVPAWNKSEALRIIKDYYCPKSRGRNKEQEYDPKSIRLLYEFDSEEEAKKWQNYIKENNMRHFHEHRHCNCHHRLDEKQVISTVNTTRVDDEGMKRCPICGNEEIEERELCFGDGIYDLGQTMYCPECDKEWTSWWRLKYDTSNVKNRYKHGDRKWSYRTMDDVGMVPGNCPYCGSLDTFVEGTSTDHVKNVVVTNQCERCHGLWDDIWEITEYVDTRIDDPEADQARYDHDQYHRMVNKFYGKKRLDKADKEELEEIDRLYKKYGGGLEIPGYC